jgi:hypothetical protein
MSDYFPQKTIQYKTFVKNTMVLALQDVFRNHPDKLLQDTKVSIEYPRTRAEYPIVIVRFFERDISNAGVGHKEWIKDDDTGQTFKFEHSFYNGDIEFAIYGLSSYDRDLISDTVVQVLRFGDLEGYTNRFLAKIYLDDPATNNVTILSFNSDYIQGFGESQAPVVWQQEDAMVYTTSYRCRLWGEFYSLPPNIPVGFVSKILLYPYIEGVEPLPTGLPDNDEAWEGD